MGNHITYLFGAGASAKSMPIVSEINEQIKALSETLRAKTHIANSGIPLTSKTQIDNAIKPNNGLGIFPGTLNIIETIKKHRIRFENFETIDTYAKYLILRNQESDLTELKQIVDLYFSFRHFADSFTIYPDKVKRGEELVFLEKYDSRYDSLMATLLQRDSTKGLTLPDNVSFLSWNYDLEAELSYSKFFHGIESNTLERFKKIPSMLHLNGHSTIPEDGIKNWESYSNQLTRDSGQAIRYAFDGGIEERDRKKLNNIINRTTHLVVIGYSFPTFNREIDSKIVRGKNLTHVYVQDLDLDSAEITKEKLLSLTKDNKANIFNRIDESNVIPMRSAKQFYIPTEINDSTPISKRRPGGLRALNV
ncbi:MAG: hypothetical protein AB8F78_14000 [Saprospiraceae bacterium]